MDVAKAGRISKEAFIVSTSALFGIVIVSLVFRLHIRLVYQRQISLDDGMITFGVALLIVAMGALYYFKDEMYTIEALTLGEGNVFLSSIVISEAFNFRRWVIVSLVILWTAITTVKLSFLILFKRLIQRMHAMNVYWWCVFAYTVAVYGFGLSAYFAPCPDFYSLATLLTCNSGSQLHLTEHVAIAQQTLDVFGDLLILVIPVKLIWQVKVRWTQKIALFMSLCLSILLVAVTITRASGLLYRRVVDAVWEVYWQYISAEVGLILSSATAFRAFFITRQNAAELAARQQRAIAGSDDTALRRLRRFISTAFSSILSTMNRSRQSPRTAYPPTDKMHASVSPSERPSDGDERELDMLPTPPRALMTGIRSFIQRNGRESRTTPSRIMMSHTVEVQFDERDDHSDQWPIRQAT